MNPCVCGATAVVACAFDPNGSTTRNSTLFGLSKRQYNGTLYYKNRKFSARGSISYRWPYVDQNSATGNIFEGHASIIDVDASLRCRVTDHLEVSLEGANLPDT